MSENLGTINWYPGHMARTKRQLQEQIRRVDLIIEVCDARLPYSSRNPDLDCIIGSKNRLLFLNKADLADSDMNKAWLAHFRSQGIDAYLTDAVRTRAKDTVRIIERATKAAVDKALAKGVRKTVRAMIVGVPNAGKSTLINSLHGKAVARIGDRPGVTKSNQWVRISPYLELLDTPGMLWPRLDDQTAARRLCYIGSVKDDVVDINELALSLLEELCSIVPDKVKERYHIEDTGVRGAALLDAACAGRGWLLKGAQPDYDRGCSVILDEYRAGKLGRITLEAPPAMPERRQGTDDGPQSEISRTDDV